MLKYISWIAVVMILMACNDNKIEKTEETFKDNTPKVVGIYSINDNNEEEKTAEKVFFPTGELRMQGPIKNNLRDGIWKSYFKNGNIQSEGVFENGLRNGVAVVYHENGNKLYEGFYTQGQKSGNWKFYGKDGTLLKEQNFDQ